MATSPTASASNANAKDAGSWDDLMGDVMRLVKSQASFDINLEGAEDGKVVTRFPPEPSGYLHIGHAKAALLNDYFAKKYHGKLIVRFDDTNTDKANQTFEDSIIKDLKDMGIEADVVEYTSDYFEKLQQMAEDFIKEGKAYVDGTPQEEMRRQRMALESNKYRDQSVEENLKLWKEMLKGSEEGVKHCLRAKISMTSKNGAMRDPIMYRCKTTEHHRTGDKYKAYPTYDFSCPLVDSISGVTHALRTLEYQDRNAQYKWFADAASLRAPQVWGYARLNFVRTELSKRKLQKLVDLGVVEGWDDPRFPTVQGVRRRGLTIKGLRAFILSQGPSRNDTTQEWDKIWTVNKRVIDPIAPRFTAISADKCHKAKLLTASSEEGGKPTPYPEEHVAVPAHKKNDSLGTKVVICGPSILLEKEDAEPMQMGEIVTLMDLGNARVDSVLPDLVLCYMPGNKNFKKTRKLTWLTEVPDLVLVDLHSYGHLMKPDLPKTKSKTGSNEPEVKIPIEDRVNPDTEKIEHVKADVNTRMLQKGDVIQLERRGYYIVDRVSVSASKPMKLIEIPDGKVEQKKHADAAAQNGNKTEGPPGLSKKELKFLKKKEKKERQALRKAKAKAEAGSSETNEEDAAEEGKAAGNTVDSDKVADKMVDLKVGVNRAQSTD
eukprot:Plantae.Rhodophyta-Hildenbrandia_rubra.ctg5717.p1 GENE.Plantae.Rhodophyta-Hildenbrandia_rubra.ctg5717~~Plantae.Rhodophyta-Hildenbrandia_rubra.ctg5717.p1  ORF type:complete len:660 (-),score=156.19 Plantae.Rhodophyta-Hildenbrandia_rubra.ctg5717:47-2026(-)